jgi:hypothetical protein
MRAGRAEPVTGPIFLRSSPHSARLSIFPGPFPTNKTPVSVTTLVVFTAAPAYALLPVLPALADLRLPHVFASVMGCPEAPEKAAAGASGRRNSAKCCQKRRRADNEAIAMPRPNFKYAKPPIQEAICEIHFNVDAPLSAEQIAELQEAWTAENSIPTLAIPLCFAPYSQAKRFEAGTAASIKIESMEQQPTMTFAVEIEKPAPHETALEWLSLSRDVLPNAQPMTAEERSSINEFFWSHFH